MHTIATVPGIGLNGPSGAKFAVDKGQHVATNPARPGNSIGLTSTVNAITMQ